MYPFVLDATGFFHLSTVQTRPSHADRPTPVEMCRARDEQRRVRDPPCMTDFGHVRSTSNVNITVPIEQIIYIVKKASKQHIVYGYLRGL